MTDRSITDFGAALGEGLAGVVGPALVGAYLHGSAALGGFQPNASDLDLLVVVDDRWLPEMREGVVRVLLDFHGSSPGRSIEASVIRDEVARSGGRRTDFELHVNTELEDTRVVDGVGHSGDPDLILHMAVCRQSAIAVLGPDPAAVFADVDPTLVARQMIDELTWALAQSSEAYAVLNACRALFYLECRMFCSKVEGGKWARNRFAATRLIDRSLAAQEGRGDDQPPSHLCRTFVDGAIATLTAEVDNQHTG